MIHLVIGGARSGKSRYAELQADKLTEEVIYVATASDSDVEMRRRIEMHRQSRPAIWQLIEEPFNLADVIRKHSDSHLTLIIECMTLWLSNWLCTNDKDGWLEEKQAFIDALLASKAKIVIVSNEVGSGIVPLGELSRDFVDHSGWLNQALAELAEKVTLVVAGCPLELKVSAKTDKITGLGNIMGKGF